jgi:hypothetical protein
MQVQLKLKIPQRLSDITLEQYQKYVKIIDGIDKEGKDSANFANLKALEIFCGLELKDSYNIPLKTFESVLEQVGKCLNEETPLVKRFWFRGTNGTEVEFGMHPNLHNISAGEYMDLDNYINDFQQMHKAMAVLFRPIVKKKGYLYDIEQYAGTDKYAEHMKHMPVNVALGAYVFFYRLGMKLSKHTMDSSLSRLKPEERSRLERTFLERNGVGINRYMRSLQEMSESLTKSPSSTYTNV